MSQGLCLAAVVVSWLVFGAIGMAIGERSDEAGRTTNSGAVFGVLAGTAGAVLVGVALRLLGWW